MRKSERHAACKSILLQHIDASMVALDVVRKLLSGGNPARLDRAMAAFQIAFEALRHSVETSENMITAEEAGRLRQLEVMHHKIMRITANKMHHIEEDIQMIDHARSQLHRTAEMASMTRQNGKP